MAKIGGYLTIKDAAEILGVTTNTLRNWERNHKIKPYRHPYNGYRLYKEEDLIAIMEIIEKQEGGKK